MPKALEALRGISAQLLAASITDDPHGDGARFMSRIHDMHDGVTRLLAEIGAANVGPAPVGHPIARALTFLEIGAECARQAAQHGPYRRIPSDRLDRDRFAELRTAQECLWAVLGAGTVDSQRPALVRIAALVVLWLEDLTREQITVALEVTNG